VELRDGLGSCILHGRGKLGRLQWILRKREAWCGLIVQRALLLARSCALKGWDTLIALAGTATRRAHPCISVQLVHSHVVVGFETLDAENATTFLLVVEEFLCARTRDQLVGCFPISAAVARPVIGDCVRHIAKRTPNARRSSLGRRL
jgi:hypothetical protein